jgi:hypothetical protein
MHYAAVPMTSLHETWGSSDTDAPFAETELGGIIQDVDTASHSLTLEMKSPYTEPLPLKITYATHTIFERRATGSLRSLLESQLGAGMSVLVRTSRDGGSLKADNIIVLSYL